MRLTLLEVVGGGVDELQGNKLEAALLEAGNDVSDETALDAVGLLLSRCDRTSFINNTAINGSREGPHLDHDVRAFVSGGHDGRCFLLWLMMLLGEEREMGRCEKERADFKQEADHPSIFFFQPAKFGDSRPPQRPLAHGHTLRSHATRVR